MERTRGCHISTHLGCFTPHSSSSHDMGEDNENKQDQVSSSMNMDWKSATCAVCMEPPHNAILLLCSSHEKGCRPYMCNTGYQHSNCLELFKKAYTVSVSTNQKTLQQHSSAICNKSKVLELPCPQCPLCRGQVKGWTVIGPARNYLDNKRRSCMQGECSFIGTFLELQQHIRENHPFPKPLEVDPELEKRWREIELERERQDVISFISSSMPNSVILGDYVIDRGELHNSLDNGILYGAEHRVFRDLNDVYYHRTTNVPRVHRHRRRRQRQRRIQGRWMHGFRPFFGKMELDVSIVQHSVTSERCVMWNFKAQQTENLLCVDTERDPKINQNTPRYFFIWCRCSVPCVPGDMTHSDWSPDRSVSAWNNFSSKDDIFYDASSDFELQVLY